jgi:cytochrome c-type biogenesis protein
MELPQIGLGLALLAGLASFLSPCVFSLVPAYISYLGGRTAGMSSETRRSKFYTFTHGLAFVLGFSLVFIILGIASSALSNLLFNMRGTLSKIGGIVVIIFGIHMVGIIRIPFLEYDTRRQDLPEQRFGYLSSFLLGIFFSAGWSPCVGPILGSILTISLAGGSVIQGATLLTAYSIGLAIPFLIAALGIGWVSIIIRRYGKAMRYIEIIMGVILIIVGVMLFLGTFQTLSRFGFFVDFGL